MTAKERVRSGLNYPMRGAEQSPLGQVVPARLVPVVATVATIAAMALWPFLMKTLFGLLKKMFAGLLKQRAKKGKKLEQAKLEYRVLGFRLRPAELTAILVGAVIYGLAICYTLKGWALTSSFIVTQELLVVALAFSRGFVRFVYERTVGLPTRFKFWPGGGLLCFVSAYLGNTLGTVGFELESAKGREQLAMKLKSWLVLASFLLALGFFTANLLHPDKILQSGRVITSGMALGDIMPVAPMAGQKIYQWRKGIWAVLFLLITPTYFAINFFI